MLSTQTLPKAKNEKTVSLKKLIHVFSIDFDGCLGNNNFKKSLSPNKLLECNFSLFLNLRQITFQEPGDEVIFMIGSSRQDQHLDHAHFLRGNEAAFPVYARLPDVFNKITDNSIPCKIDDYLIADTFGARKIGDNFNHAVKSDSSYPYSFALPETSKLPILYAQMHKLAVENPSATIIYDFYDDRNDIYQPLHDFFSHNTDLMPHNVTLRIHEYNGGDITTLNSTIQGTGNIQHHFQENVHLIIELTNFSKSQGYNETAPEQYSLLQMFDKPATLNEFRNQILINDVMRQLDDEIKLVTSTYANQSDYQEFLKDIANLRSDLRADIDKMKFDGNTSTTILQSHAVNIADLTTNMLVSLRMVTVEDTYKKQIHEEIITSYKAQCQSYLSNTAYASLAKLLGSAAVLVTGTYIGNQIINMASSTTKILTTGIVAGIAGSLFYFKPDKYAEKIDALAKLKDEEWYEPANSP